MRFHLEFSLASLAYLDALSLTRQGRLRLYVGLHLHLRAIPDAFRNDPANRPGPNPSLFLGQYLFQDAGQFRALFCAVDDSGAAYGALRVEYVECV